MKKGIKILLLADMWATLAAGMIGPIYAIFVEDIGGDLLDASWAFFAFMITTGAVLYLISRWEDKVKHKEKLLTLGYSIKALGFFSYLFVYNQTTLVATQIILGLSTALMLPAFDSLYSQYLQKNEEASNWGAWEAMWYVVTAIAAVIGGYVAANLGFKVLFVFMFIVSLFSVIFSLQMHRKNKYLMSD